jgi:hypothetical protein
MSLIDRPKTIFGFQNRKTTPFVEAKYQTERFKT